MILLTDANILIDLGHVGALALLPALAPTEVLSTVLLECRHDTQPTLIADIHAAGIQGVEVTDDLLSAATRFTNSRISVQDRQALLYALDNHRVLLTGDEPVRQAAAALNVEVHGTIWLLEQAIARALYANDELCRWLTLLPALRRRLPRTHLHRLKTQLGCA